ncbi:MAG: DUF3899 domain-containing protein [Firmicutes bacterium]|nr:DUF3899 domain-containing protein [Candidatus Fiminaster equi]
MKSKFRKDLKYYLIAAAITLAIGIGFFCLFFFVRGKTVGYGILNWQDSLMIVGIILLCCGCLMAVAREGFFDIFAYGFKQLGNSLFSKSAHAYNDYPGYREDKKTKRASSPKIFVSVLIVAAVVLLVALSLYIAAKSFS